MVESEGEHDRLNRLSYMIIGCAIRVHKELGPGMKESVYEECLVSELTQAGLRVEQQNTLAVVYRGRRIHRAYRPDIMVDGTVAVEVKSVSALTAVHRSQLRAYLKQSKLKLGLLINFNVKWLRDGVQREVNGFPD